MDNQRLFIWAFFGLLAWMTYQTWVQDYAPAVQPVPTTRRTCAPGRHRGDEELPAIATRLRSGATEALPQPRAEAAATTARRRPRSIASRQTSLKSRSAPRAARCKAPLSGYPVAKDRPDELVKLLIPQADASPLSSPALRAAGGRRGQPPAQLSSGPDYFELGRTTSSSCR